MTDSESKFFPPSPYHENTRGTRAKERSSSHDTIGVLRLRARLLADSRGVRITQDPDAMEIVVYALAPENDRII